jgi:pyruvate dehydrogenase E2 component (dihydrolipoamide acetyltransferase)
MASEITMPQMGFDMTEGVVANWLKAEGDTIQKGEPIAEIETDKTTMQIEAFASGVLTKIIAPAGAKVPVGNTIGIISAPGEVAASPVPAPQAASPALAKTEVVAPVKVVNNAAVNATPVARRAAEQMGIDLSQVKGSGPDGQVTKADVEGYIAPKSEPVAQPAPVASTGRIIATPVAKKIASERGVDLRQVKGSGPEGRIVLADVEGAAGKGLAPMAAIPQPVAQTPMAVPVTQPAATSASTAQGGMKRITLTRIRQTIAQRMTQSKTTVPHFYITVAVEMDAALKLREQVNEALKADGMKVSVNDLIIRATALALKRFPNLNASFTGDAIEQHENIHVGVAVSVPTGLVTVTVHDADTKTLKQIAVEMVALAARVRDGKAQPGDLGGQTFTISNLGMFGV